VSPHGIGGMGVSTSEPKFSIELASVSCVTSLETPRLPPRWRPPRRLHLPVTTIYRQKTTQTPATEMHIITMIVINDSPLSVGVGSGVLVGTAVVSFRTTVDIATTGVEIDLILLPENSNRTVSLLGVVSPDFICSKLCMVCCTSLNGIVISVSTSIEVASNLRRDTFSVIDVITNVDCADRDRKLANPTRYAVCKSSVKSIARMSRVAINVTVMIASGLGVLVLSPGVGGVVVV
jgi:hypothetical protein